MIPTLLVVLLVYLAFGFGLAIGWNASAPKYARVGFITLSLVAVTWPYALYWVLK